MSQTFRDYEVIMVDDSSTDGGGDLCDEMAQRYANIKVIHQANTGSGGARNTGIDAASGKYIAFFDIDDLVSPDWLERLYEYLVQYHPQLMIYGYQEVNTRYHTNIPYRFEFALYESNAELRNKYVDTISGLNFNNGFVWNKVYDHQFIKEHSIQFENLRIQQDEVFNLSIYPIVDRVVVLPDILYEYFVYYKGNTTSRYIPERLDIYRRVRDAFVEMCNIWELKDKRFLMYIYKRFYDSVLYDIKYNLYHTASNLSAFERQKAIKSIISAGDIKYCVEKLLQLGYAPTGWIAKMYFDAFVKSNVRCFQMVRYLDNKIGKLKCCIKQLFFNK